MTDISQVLPPTQQQAQQAETASGNVNSPAEFATALLEALNLPVTQAAIQAISAWQIVEGQWTAGGSWNAANNHNPLNIEMGGQTQNAGGGNNISIFGDWQSGVQNAADYIRSHVPGLVQAFQAGGTAQQLAQAIDGAGWGGAGTTYGGAVVNALNQVGAANAVPTSAPGAGTGPGMGGQGGAAPPYNPQQPGGYPITPAIRQWIMENAPQDAWMLSNPELAPILGYAGANGIVDTNEINGLISQTGWYKSHAAQQRAWTQLYASDPQEAAREIQQSQAVIRTQAGQMGVTLTQDQLNSLSINDNYYAWTPQELQYAISSYLPSNQAPTAGGAAQVDFQSLKATATQTWGVPTSDQQIATWVAQIAAGTQTMDGVTAMLKTQAQSLYPTLADQFTRGFTFAQATDPYKQIASQYLNVDPNSINFTDPKWQAAVSSVDPKTGQRTEMGLDQWTNYIRSNPAYGYQNTTMAKNEMVGLSDAMAKQLGVIA